LQEQAKILTRWNLRKNICKKKRKIIRQLLEEYEIGSAEDIHEALKDLLGGTIKEMMEAEMDNHLGYGKSERSNNDDYRNGYKTKRVNSSCGSVEIQVTQDRKSTSNPQRVKKHQKDIRRAPRELARGVKAKTKKEPDDV